MSHQIQQTLGFHLFQTSMRLKAAFARILRPYDITPEQFTLLSLLSDTDGLQQREIAELLFKDRPNVTRILEKLEKKGLVLRKKDPGDRRASRVHITSSGQERYTLLNEAASSFRSRAYRGLEAADKKRLKASLNQIMENLS
ncbi:MAG: MarR family transcriptional regulator [Candidatus Sedimenticola sp. (ex Thyasira tokunagai)]